MLFCFDETSLILIMPPVNLNSPVRFDDDLPDAVDVVIIGGGVAGVCAAKYLKQAGVSVFLCEKGRVAGEQSSRNWGWVRQQGRDEAELPIMMDSINAWEKIDRELGAEIGFERRGTLYLAETEVELADLEGWIKIAESHQLDSKMLGRKQLDELIKAHKGNWIGGLYTASDAHAEPFTAVPTLAKHLHEQGIGIKENCAVRVLESTAGHVSGVVTEHGLIRASSILLTGGAWSSTFLRNIGIALAQLNVRSTVARTESVPDFFSGNGADSKFAFRRRQDGGYTLAPGGFNEHFLSQDSIRYFREFRPLLWENFKNVRLRFGWDLPKGLLPHRRWTGKQESPFEQTRLNDPFPAKAALQKIQKGVAENLPMLREVPFEETWAGLIDVTPDLVPVMDEVSDLPGLFIGTGFSGHGFGFGPGAGETLANLVLGNAQRHDITRFRFSRFSDGSVIHVGPGL